LLTFDANILVYASDVSDPARRAIAREVIDGGTRVPAFLTNQVVGEFCNAVRRKRGMAAADAIAQVEAWATFFEFAPTSLDQLMRAATLAEQRKKQFWDMVIICVAAEFGATVMFSEDIGDGEAIEGVRILNPFNPANRKALAAILRPSS
jgi:predicted nucleic acid-binding protein